jgi:hypothetical protein
MANMNQSLKNAMLVVQTVAVVLYVALIVFGVMGAAHLVRP